MEKTSERIHVCSASVVEMIQFHPQCEISEDASGLDDLKYVYIGSVLIWNIFTNPPGWHGNSKGGAL